MGLGEKDGEEFDQVKVAPIPVLKLHVPDEFVLGGHVVVSDHAAVPPRAELHPDESSDEMVRGRGGGRRGRVLGGRGGITGDPSLPMGQRGLRWWAMGERWRPAISPVGDFVGRIHERTSPRSPLVPPPTYIEGGDNGGRGRCRRRGVERRRGGLVEGPSSSGDGCWVSLWDGVGRRARADRREGSGGYTRCSRRYWGRNRGVRVRIRVTVG